MRRLCAWVLCVAFVVGGAQVCASPQASSAAPSVAAFSEITLRAHYDEALENLRAGHAAALQRERDRHEIIITWIDKLGIAMLIAIAGFWLNLALERFKSSLAVNSELEKSRVASIADAWKAMYEWERQIDLFRTSASSGSPSGLQQERLQSRLAELEVRAQETRQQVEQNQFWMGSELYEHLRDYHNTLLPLLSAYVARDPRRIAFLHRRLHRSKQHVVLYTAAERFVGNKPRRSLADRLYQSLLG